MENASELEAPRMSIQTKDLIRCNNHTTYYNKNHSKFIQKSQQHSTANHLTSHYQPTAKRLAPLPSDNRKLSLSSQLSSAALIAHPSPGRGHSTQHLHPNSRAAPSPAALKNQPVRRVLPVAGLCRRGADSWLAEICVVFQKSAV